MRSAKKKFYADFTHSFQMEKKFDAHQFKANEHKVKAPVSPLKRTLQFATFTLIIVLLIPIIFFLSVFVKIEDTARLYDKSYTLSEKRKIETSSFKALNEVQYPNTNYKELKITDEFKNAYLNFTYAIEKEGKNILNFGYSPLNLYGNLHMFSAGYEENDVASFNQLLGLDFSHRDADYKKTYENNFLIQNNGTTQMYHGAFFTNRYELNSSYLDILTSDYVEAFQMDFQNEKDVSMMLQWINEKMQEDSFISMKDIPTDNLTTFYIFSTLYFSQKWNVPYYEKDTAEQTFYMANNQNKRIPFMHHSYYGLLYEYENYYSFYDSYKNGYQIQYVTPKGNNTIQSALENQNIFIEDATKQVKIENLNSIIIDLKVPKMNMSMNVDFVEILKSLGLASSFEYNNKNLQKVFSGEQEMAMEICMQKNHIVFNEDGTRIQSLNIGGAGARSAGYKEETFEVTLDHPFIYVIYDVNKLPIFIGHVDNL